MDKIEQVHLVEYASQPDLLILCDQTWTTPAWGDPMTSAPSVYRADDGRLYAFDRALVTCDRCKVDAARSSAKGCANG